MKNNFQFVLWCKQWKYFLYYGIALFIFLFGLILSFGTFRLFQLQDVNRLHDDFDRLADLRLYVVQDLFLESLQQIKNIKSLYHVSKDVTQEEFKIFTRSIFNLYPNFLALGWIKIHASNVLHPSLSGLNFVSLIEKSKPNRFFPLTYLEFSHAHPRLIFDTTEYKTFVNELQKSQNSIKTIISDNIFYFQKEKKPGFFLFKSIFFKREKIPLYSLTRLFGTVIGFSNFEDILKMADARIGPMEIHINIYDITEGRHDLIYGNEVAVQERIYPSPQEQWTRDQTFKFGNRTWKLQATPTPTFIREHQMPFWQHWDILFIRILLATLVTFYFLALANRRIRIEEEVQNRTNELATINNILQKEIHERQRIEEDFMAKQRYLQRRHEALKYLTKLTTPELRTTIQEVILRTALVMQVDRVSVWFHKTIDDTELLSCAGLYILSTNSFSNHLEITSTHFPHYFQALSNHLHLIFPSPQDAELNQELASYLAVFHINTKLDIPIIFEGKLLGVLSCEETRGHREWILEDRHFGQTIADIIAIMIEQSARQKVEEALKESEERLRFITQQSIDGIISINDKEEIISWNFGAQQMFGYQKSEIIGQSLRLVIPQNEFFLKKEISTKPIELRGKHKDGQFFPVEISETRWSRGEAYSNTIIIRDITERKNYEKRLINAMRDANAANAAKSEFLATISHELRTPLNAIIGFDQCLLIGMDGPINELQQESLKKIEKSSFHLLKLINDILDLSKIEAKKIELEIEPENIVEIVASCIEEIQSLAYQKSLDIYVSIDKSFILVEIDRLRIRQVLLNLLSNAIKFTEQGFIKVSVSEISNQIFITISDTGIGLSSEEIEKLFRPFSQADSSITRKYGGTGLGLIISKDIINLHSGTITVESQKGQGSTFTITLPKFQA